MSGGEEVELWRVLERSRREARAARESREGNPRCRKEDALRSRWLGIVLVGAAALALGGCQNPDERVPVGYRGYRTLPPGSEVSWPSSGTSNGRGCVPAPGRSADC
jgi:hypothetical protein